MTDIRIVCTYDAVKLAEALTRLFEAEEHNVRLLFGRNSINELEQTRATACAVLMIWSPDAPSQHYMLEWARGVDPHKLIEIARAPGWPKIDRVSQVIDFTGWRGERGGRAWNALNDRLRQVARVLAPPRPPARQATLALGLASIAAVGGAALLRFSDAPQAVIAEADEAVTFAAVESPPAAIGGPLLVEEPASAEDLELAMQVNAAIMPTLELTPAPDLVDMPSYIEPELRDPTLIERLMNLTPLEDESTGG